jgi:hypothetical protein
MQRLWKALKQATLEPTLKQKEAYARFLHTLSAASIIAAVSIIFTETAATSQVVSRVVGLLVCSVIYFIIGAILSKGE